MSGYIGIIGGSGIGDALAGYITDGEMLEIDTPFGKPSSPILAGKIGGNKVLFLNRHGKGHQFSPSDVPYASNVYALKACGATSLIATGAVGSLREHIHPGQLVIVDQFIDKTFRRQSSFFESVAAVHCEFSHPCCGRLSDKLSTAAKNIDTDVHDGAAYVCMEGPQFSTVAESNMHRSWGGDLVGMTAMPEAKLTREAQMCYSLIAMPSDYDCWRAAADGKDKQSLLKEIIGNLNKCSENAIKLIETALASGDGFCDDDCPCRKSLELAFWSQREAVDATKLKSLEILFE